jgi:hypothetical protein
MTTETDNVDHRASELAELKDKPHSETFQKMPMALEPEPAAEEPYKANVEDLRRAGRDLQDGREVPAPTIERGYIRAAGPDAGSRMPIHLTRTLSESAKDLAEMRRVEAAAEHEQAVTEFQQQVDLDRAVDRDAQQPPTPQPAQQSDLQPQPVEQVQAQPQDGLSNKVRQALADPEIRSAIQAEIQSASTAQQAYSAAVAQLQQAATASLLSQVPELQNVRPDQAQVVLETIAKTSPARANEIAGAIQNAQRNMAVVEQHRQAAYAQQQQQFQAYAKASDAAFDSFAATRPAAEVKAVKDNIVSVLAEDFGLDPNALAQLYNSTPALRSVEAQKLIYAAVRNSLAERAMRNTPKGLPPVAQRPGTVDTTGTYDPRLSPGLTAAAAEFKSKPSLRSGARQLAELRRARANQR